MKFLFYFFIVSVLAAVPASFVGALFSFVSDDIGLFVGLFVFVGLVWQSFAQRKP